MSDGDDDVSEDEDMDLLQRLVQGVAIKVILGHGGQPGPTLWTQADIVVDIGPRICRGQTEDRGPLVRPFSLCEGEARFEILQFFF